MLRTLYEESQKALGFKKIDDFFDYIMEQPFIGKKGFYIAATITQDREKYHSKSGIFCPTQETKAVKNADHLRKAQFLRAVLSDFLLKNVTFMSEDQRKGISSVLAKIEDKFGDQDSLNRIEKMLKTSPDRQVTQRLSGTYQGWKYRYSSGNQYQIAQEAWVMKPLKGKSFVTTNYYRSSPNTAPDVYKGILQKVGHSLCGMLRNTIHLYDDIMPPRIRYLNMLDEGKTFPVHHMRCLGGLLVSDDPDPKKEGTPVATRTILYKVSNDILSPQECSSIVTFMECAELEKTEIGRAVLEALSVPENKQINSLRHPQRHTNHLADLFLNMGANPWINLLNSE